MSHLESVNGQNFQEQVLNATGAVLVDFWAEWCGPCRALTPILEEVSELKKESVKIVKMNVDEDRHYATQYGVRGIPYLILFQKGEVRANHQGLLSKSQLLEFLEEHL